MKPLKKLVLSMMVLLIPLVSSGCWDYREVDSLGYVLVLGLDKGKENRLTVTAQIAVPRRMGIGGQAAGGGGAARNPGEVLSVEAPDVLTSITMMDSFLSRQLTVRHVKAVVVSEELARDGVLKHLEIIERFPSFRRSIFFAVSRGVSAKELLQKNIPIMESSPSKYMELFTAASSYTGFSPVHPHIHYFINASKSMGADPIAMLLGVKRKTPQGKGPPFKDSKAGKSEGSYYAGGLPRTGGNQLEAMGAALFKRDRLVGEINGEEMAALMILRNLFQQGYFSVPDPGSPGQVVSVKLFQTRPPEVSIDVSRPIPRIHLKVPLEGDVLAIPSGTDYELPGLQPRLQQAVARKMKKELEALLHKTQRLGVDPAWLGEKAKVQFLTWQQWKAYNWHKVYPQAEIRVEVEINLRQFGLLWETIPNVGGER